MKNFLCASAIAGVAVLAGTITLNAQDNLHPGIPGSQITGVNDYTVEPGAVSFKVLKDFAVRYKNVTEERWTKTRNDFSANFISNGVSHTIFYNSDGKWTGSLKGYYEEKLPREVKNMVRYECNDDAVIYVQEIEAISSYGGPTYLIYLEGKHRSRLMKIHDGQTDFIQELKRS